MDYTQDPTAKIIAGFLQRWLAANPQWAYETATQPLRMRNAQDVAADIAGAMERYGVTAARWFESPDGKLITAAVGWVMPWPQGAEFKLLVSAMLLAAQKRNAGQKTAAGALAGLALVAFLLRRLG